MKKRNLVLFGSAAMLSLALAGSLGTFAVASAEEEITNGAGGSTTTVSYTKENAWKITIPESITIGNEGTIQAEGVAIEQGKTLNVKVTSAHGFRVQNEGGDKEFEYELKTSYNGGSTAVANEGVVLGVAAGTETGNASLSATLKNSGDSKYSTGGETYTDTLTFSVEVANAD